MAPAGPTRASLAESLVSLARRAQQAIRNLFVARGTVAYVPRFHDADDVANHFYRAAWYLPEHSHCRQVTMWTTNQLGTSDALRCPSAMAPPRRPPGHIELITEGIDFIRKLLRAEVVLVWRAGRWATAIRTLRRLGIRIVNVDTDCAGGGEYVHYALLLWQELTPRDRMQATQREQRERFLAIAERLRGEVGETAYVFGTGPSLNRSREHDFSQGLRVACNSIVASPDLLEHIAPHFIAAADVVSHFGVSLYAARFRDELARALTEDRRAIFVTSTALGTLLLAHRPELAPHTLMIDYGGDDPALDLTTDYRAPAMESVLNSFMLPLAATFARDIVLIGCDGKGASRDDEDFWPHSTHAHFHELVASGHACHPTFDPARQAGGYERYDADVRRTLQAGARHGHTYRCLYPSRLPALAHLG